MAAKRKIESSTQTVGEILRKPVYFRVPSNQRDFAWGKEEVDALWNDLIAALGDGRGEYFLGAIVVSPGVDAKTLEIVDGQQRLASLAMILAAISDAWKKEGDTERADDVFREFLGSKERRSRQIVPKIALNETNDPVFQSAVLQRKQPTTVEKKSWPKSNRLLLEATERFTEHLSKWLDENTDREAALIELETFVTDSAAMILIEVGDEYDAFVIFETLNDRGLALAVSDLVKNYLFSHADVHLDAFKKSWNEISLLVGGEHLTSFLRHLWMSEYELVRERELYRRLREKVKTKTLARQFMERLRKAADLYAALLNPEHSYWTDFDADAKRHLETLKLFRAAQFRPLALAVMESGTPDQVTSMLRIVSILTFRYTIVSGLSAAELERTYSDAALSIRSSGKRNPKAIFDLLKTAYVDDTRFVQDFAAGRFAKADIARYVLGELEQTLAGSKEKKADVATLTLEHVLPRNPSGTWAKAIPSGEDAEDYVERIGNLTLLEKSANKKIGNKDFATKKTGGYAKSLLALNKTLAAAADWNSIEIAKRSTALAAAAKKAWHLDL